MMPGQPELSFVKFRKDAYIVVEGKKNADCFFIIREGMVQLSKEVIVVAEEGGDVLVPGDFFGVIATMSGHSYIETALALTDVVLIAVKRDQYSMLIKNTASVAMKITLQFSKRMRYLNDSLTKITLKQNAETEPSHLFTVGEYYARQNQLNLAYYAFTQYLKYCPDGWNVHAAKVRLNKLTSLGKTARLEFDPNQLIRKYPKDVMIFSEGEPGDAIYIIKTGLVKITKIVDNNEVLLAVLKEGDIFGEMALLESKPRAACAVTYDNCQLMVVNRENFSQMITTQPQLITRLTTVLADRIWLIYKQLANTLINDPLGRVYDMMLVQLEKKRVDLFIKQQYTFDFGIKELIHMVGLSREEGDTVMQKLIQSKYILIVKDKICITDITEIFRLVSSIRKLQEIEMRNKSR